MEINRVYSNYEDYITYQAKKTKDPERQKKWLGPEWNSKIEGFKKEFSKISSLLNKNSKILCLGARTGQEVQALRDLGFENSIGIDIVPFEPLVILGDIHNLNFEDESFDLVYSNILDHSLYPSKMISEIERVLKVDGFAFLQIQYGIHQDEYTEFKINDPIFDVNVLFEMCYCCHIGQINADGSSNFAGMNLEFLFQKDKDLLALKNKVGGSLQNAVVPENYLKIWNEINLPIQEKKLNSSNIIDAEKREGILNSLKKRAYYLACLADVYRVKTIAEVGTAEGWQFYSFCEYANANNGRVYSCDPRDVRNSAYKEKFENENLVGFFINGDSKEMSNVAHNVEMFYIDGLHGENDVINDVSNLLKCQADNPIWVFDDFDERFGCFKDILKICQMGKRFKIWAVGLTASGHPSHQVLVKCKFL